MVGDPLRRWYAEIISQEVVVSPNDIGAEASGNLRALSLTPQEAASLAAQDVNSTVNVAIAALAEQLAARDTGPMLFYCWHDDQAAQLCFSLVSAAHHCLPFRCEVNRVADVETIVAAFLASHYHGGIPWAELSETGPMEVDTPRTALPVWVVPVSAGGNQSDSKPPQ